MSYNNRVMKIKNMFILLFAPNAKSMQNSDNVISNSVEQKEIKINLIQFINEEAEDIVVKEGDQNIGLVSDVDIYILKLKIVNILQNVELDNEDSKAVLKFPYSKLENKIWRHVENTLFMENYSQKNPVIILEKMKNKYLEKYQLDKHIYDTGFEITNESHKSKLNELKGILYKK